MTPPEAKKILCIEDNPVNWRLVQRLLSQAGYDMHWAEEGLKGYEMAIEQRPDLLLLDINLPGLSGFELATKFRNTPELKGMVIVALTAKTQKSDRETALVAGCDGFIPKPIDPFTFVSQVESYLEGAREQLEQAREGAALRQFSAQVLEHLEVQLKEAQMANRKLTVAQEALESRNQSLSRLLSLSQDIFSIHNPDELLGRVLERAAAEAHAKPIAAFRVHSSGGYFSGVTWDGQQGAVLTMPMDHPFMARVRQLDSFGLLSGEALKSSRIWEEGLQQGFWHHSTDAGLLVLSDRMAPKTVWGFWAFAKWSGSFDPLDLELIALHARMAQVSLENAELISNLNESSRALAVSYEQMEAAYQDLQNAKVALGQRDRQVLLEDLFMKMAHRLQEPVTVLSQQSQSLDTLLVPSFEAGSGPVWDERTPLALTQIREAVSKIDGLMKSLLRRVDKEAPGVPEWIDLHDLLTQELELLQCEGNLAPGVSVDLDLRAETPLIFGVYGDFASTLQYLVQHATCGPTPSKTIRIRTERRDDQFFVSVQDEGGAIPTPLLESALEPFSELHNEGILSVRAPGRDLPACRQFMASYRGELSIRNEGEGTLVCLSIPLQ